jgi:hypothetical protein
VRTAVREGIHVVERGGADLEGHRAVHAPAPAIAQGGVLERALRTRTVEVNMPLAAGESARRAGQRDPKMSTS